MDIFRFVLCRPPKKHSPPSVISLNVELTSLGQRLESLRQGDEPRKRIKDAVASFLASNDFTPDPSELYLYSELENLARRIENENALSLSALHRLVQDTLGRSVSELLSDSQFRALRIRVTEAILALKVQPGFGRRVLADYVKLFRTLNLVDRISQGDKSLDTQNPRSLLHSSLQLPTSIFPLPRTFETVSEKDREAERQRNIAVASLTSKIHSVDSAIRELESVASLVATPPGKSSNLIRVMAHLSVDTKSVLTSFKVEAATTPVKTAISRLTKEVRVVLQNC